VTSDVEYFYVTFVVLFLLTTGAGGVMLLCLPESVNVMFYVKLITALVHLGHI